MLRDSDCFILIIEIRQLCYIIFSLGGQLYIVSTSTIMVMCGSYVFVL